MYDLNGLVRPDWRTLPSDYSETGDARWDGLNPAPRGGRARGEGDEPPRIPEAGAGAAAAAAAAAARCRAGAGARRGEAREEGALRDGKPPEKTPLFNGVVSYGNLVFISGIGAHFEGDIKAHTTHVLDEMEKSSSRVGSSMEKVLKVNVYLNDLKDYAGMNEVFLGRFGPEPGVRTTIAAGRRHSGQLAGRDRLYRVHLNGWRTAKERKMGSAISRRRMLQTTGAAALLSHASGRSSLAAAPTSPRRLRRLSPRSAAPTFSPSAAPTFSKMPGEGKDTPKICLGGVQPTDEAGLQAPEADRRGLRPHRRAESRGRKRTSGHGSSATRRAA